jgi:hypothetical protein
MQFTVSASSISTSLQFGFRNDNEAFGLDDISVQAVSTATQLQISSQSDGSILITWTAVPGLAYQVQYKDDLAAPDWNNLGNAITATTSQMSTSASVGEASQRFYRITVP